MGSSGVQLSSTFSSGGVATCPTSGLIDRGAWQFLARSSRRGCCLGALLTLPLCATASAAILPAGSFVFDGEVNSIVRNGSDVFVGGSFTKQQTPTGGGLVLSQTGTGTPDPSAQIVGTVDAVAADGSGGWFIGGSFTHVAGQSRRSLAHILANGTLDPAWNPGSNGFVTALAVSGSNVYAAGFFRNIGGQGRDGIAAIDATNGNATAFDPDPNGRARALAVSGATVYAGGRFSSIGGQPRAHLAALAASTGIATPFNPNLNGRFVSALALSGSTLYAGGEFTSVGGQARNNLAALDATTGIAAAFSPNPGGFVSALAVTGPTVYAGGQFASIGGRRCRVGRAVLHGAADGRHGHGGRTAVHGDRVRHRGQRRNADDQLRRGPVARSTTARLGPARFAAAPGSRRTATPGATRSGAAPAPRSA